MTKLFLFILMFLIAGELHSQDKVLTNGMVINQTMRIRKAGYDYEAPKDTSRAVITIEGDNIVVDFNNAELRGSVRANTPDEFYGVAILIRNGNNITIKNLKARGYKVAILARGVNKLTIENCDLSYNYRPHLNSTQEKEDVSDWMSYHRNEKDEWLRYGAAMYLRNCNYAVIRNSKVTGGQNALMMTSCDSGRIYNNDFSFNSGIGLGMYRCSFNQILFNRINFNVRGYSHGVYARGQDSAGILVYEQSSNNIFYKNSVTHGGDGFFLWAGQTTMDNGKGGCNDNQIRSNDFSYAPTNGIEVTFSRNSIVDNRIFECDHGIWGGYSFNTFINSNKFRRNNIDIAIEHGQENSITYNVFFGSNEAIRLWGRSEQPADWGYARNRDTKSRDYIIAFNTFNRSDIVFNLNRTDHLSIFNNNYFDNKRLYKRDSTVTDLDTEGSGKLTNQMSLDSTFVSPVVPKAIDPFKNAQGYVGRKNIMITEWGPYDFRYPIIWNTNPTDQTDTMKFDILGPAGGKWILKDLKGVTDISKRSGTFPASIFVLKSKTDSIDKRIDLEYSGPAFIDQMGIQHAKGKVYKFSYRKFFQPVNWQVSFYDIDTTYYNPIKTGLIISPTEKKAPFKADTVDRLEYAWWGGIKTGEMNHPSFATQADAVVRLEKGKYELSVTWDDAVRVYVDEKLVINEWDPSLYDFDESPHKKVVLELGGEHNFRVEHIELGGFATLNVKLKRLD
jgi:hypothetical protein